MTSVGATPCGRPEVGQARGPAPYVDVVQIKLMHRQHFICREIDF
jgi:hypothetical protein